MKEFKVPLQIFGPKALYRWLFHEWESLEKTFKNVLWLLHTQTDLPDTMGEKQLMKLATTFEYERMLTALTEEEFKQFIEWALDYEQGELWPEGWPRPPIPLGLNDLDTDIQKLRQLLVLTFAKERIWPREGFRPLIQEALNAANQAMEALAFADPNISLLKRREAFRYVHNGLDRALLCAERFLDLLLEFLALVILQLGWATLDEAENWFAAIGVRISEHSGGRTMPWHKKQRVLAVELGKFWEDLEAKKFRLAPPSYESFWSDLHLLLSSCGFEQGDDGKWYATGDLMQILDNLRNLRNVARHTSSTLQESRQIPEAYINATPEIRENLLKLWRFISESDAIPQIAKVLEFSSDCYGGTEFTLALENRRVVRARYVHDLDKNELARQAERNLALAQKDFEFFLFPSPKPEEHLLINPLLIRRDYTFQELGCIDIHEETLDAIRMVTEETKVMPGEERVKEV